MNMPSSRWKSCRITSICLVEGDPSNDVDPRIGIQEVVTKIKGVTAFQHQEEFLF